jgi:hypothetical protein
VATSVAAAAAAPVQTTDAAATDPGMAFRQQVLKSFQAPGNTGPSDSDVEQYANKSGKSWDDARAELNAARFDQRHE